MNQEIRDTLKPGEILCLYRQHPAQNPATYRIESVLQKGTLYVSYRATCLENKKAGILKEYYPSDHCRNGDPRYYSMIRQTNHQLTPNGGTIRRFERDCQEYVQMQKMMGECWNVLPGNEAPSGADFSQKELLSGCSDHATVYFWITAEEISLDEYLTVIQKKSRKSPEKSMMEILTVMVMLTEYVERLHDRGLWGLSLTADHFDVSMAQTGKTYAPTLHQNPDFGAYREGSAAPEVQWRNPEPSADFYSLGKIFRCALSGLNSGGSERKTMNRNQQNVPYLRTQNTLYLLIQAILKKSLAYDPKKRYSNCRDMLLDLKQAKRYALALCTLTQRASADAARQVYRYLIFYCSSEDSDSRNIWGNKSKQLSQSILFYRNV